MNLFFSAAIVILAIPAGILLAWMARDELEEGRIWFKCLSLIFLTAGIILILFGFLVSGLSSFFASILSAVSYHKSFDRKWTRKKEI